MTYKGKRPNLKRTDCDGHDIPRYVEDMIVSATDRGSQELDIPTR